MCASAFFFSLMSVFIKFAGETLGVFEIITARGIVSMMAGWWMMRAAKVEPLGSGDRGLLILRGVLGVAALVCYATAVIRLPLAEATVFHFTSPLFTALMAAVVLGEVMGRREVAVAFLGFAGVLIIARPDFGLGIFPREGGAVVLDPIAVMIGIAGAIFSAAAYTVVRKVGQTQHHLVIINYYAVATFAIGLPLMIPGFRMPQGLEWLMLLGVGLSTQMGQIFLTKALQKERAGPAISIGYLQIGFAALWGYLFFNTLPDGWSAVGTAVIVASIIILGRLRSGRVPVASQ